MIETLFLLKGAMASQRPATRLGSKTLSQALENFIVRVVAKRYSVVSVRALWNAKNNDEELAKCLVVAKEDSWRSCCGVWEIYCLPGPA